MNAPTDQEIRRISVSSWFDPFVAVCLILGSFFLLRDTALSNVNLILIIALLTSIYYFSSELTRAHWTWRDRPRQNFSDVFGRATTKFAGVLAGIGAVLFAVWLFPAYDNVRNLDLLVRALLPFFSFIFPASFFLILFTEYVLGEKKDGTYQFGLFVQGKFRAIDWRIFLDGILEWLVRGIFVLINYYAVATFVSRYREVTMADFTVNFVRFVMELDGLIFMVILFAILPGYIFASRLIHTEVKKVDHTWFGWVITLAAYPPLNSAVFGNWMQYTPSTEAAAAFQGLPAWVYFTQQFPFALYTIGFFILVFGFIHLWGESQLGVRSANLSWRGIITTGAFRITKHPVYASKCFQWAFIYLPVLNAVGILGAVQSGLLFLMVCALFAGRSLAEEKLLAIDPDYVKYALYMDDKSIFAFVGRILPFMSFRWRYEYWKRRGLIPATERVS